MSRSAQAPTLFKLSLLNLLRKPGRSVGAVMGVILAAGTAFAGGLIALGVNHSVQVGMDRLGADLMVVPKGAVPATHTALVMGEPVSFYMPKQIADQVAAVPGVKQVASQVYVETLSSAACCTGRLFVVGYDSKADFTVKPWLDAGLRRPLAGDEIVVGSHILPLIGEKMKFYGSEFTIVDRLAGTGMGMDETVFMPVETVWQMAKDSFSKAEKPLQIPPDSVSAVLVRVADRSQTEAVGRRIEASVPGVSVVTAGQVTAGVARDLRSLMSYMVPLAAGVLLVSLVLFVLLFAAIAAERSREIGLLRTIGATSGQALGLLIGEAAILGGAGGLAGVAAGLGVFTLFANNIRVGFSLPFLWPSAAAQVGLGLAVVAGAAGIGALAAFAPAARIARRDPFFAIHPR